MIIYYLMILFLHLISFIYLNILESSSKSIYCQMNNSFFLGHLLVNWNESNHKTNVMHNYRNYI